MVLAGPSRAPPVPDDLQAEPGLFGERIGANLAAEGDGGAAVVVGVDGLDQGCGPGGPRDGGRQDRGACLDGGRVVRLRVRLRARCRDPPGVEVPPVQACGEVQVARLALLSSAVIVEKVSPLIFA